MPRIRTLLIVVAVVVFVALALHLAGGPAVEWMASLHGHPSAR